MKNNINEFNELLKGVNSSIIKMAKLYYEDLKKSHKSEDEYANKTPMTRTLLRRLISIAKNDMLPQTLYTGSCIVYRMLSTMSIEQQRVCIEDKIQLAAEDGSHWSKKFEDLSPRQMNMVYDQRAKVFRSDTAQREWIKDHQVVKLSHNGELKPIEPPEPTKEKKAKPTKAGLIKQLKALHVDAKDLYKLADARTLMQAAQMALKELS